MSKEYKYKHGRHNPRYKEGQLWKHKKHGFIIKLIERRGSSFDYIVVYGKNPNDYVYGYSAYLGKTADKQQVGNYSTDAIRMYFVEVTGMAKYLYG